MGKNSMTTLTITINAKQAEDVLESMKTKLKATSEELEQPVKLNGVNQTSLKLANSRPRV